MKYITFYNILGIFFAIIALTTSYIFIYTKNRIFLLMSAISQSFFLLEILNIKLQKSNSRYFPTVIQLFFRMFNIWIVFFLYNSCDKYFYIVMTSWYLTDCIRYLYYISRNRYIKIVRYNLFIILYPVSIFIEIRSMYLVFTKLDRLLSYLFLSFLCLYIPSMVFLIMHMFRQRKWANKKRVKTS